MDGRVLEVTREGEIAWELYEPNAALCSLPGGYPGVTLKDSKGGVVGVFVGEQFSVRSLPVGPAGKADIVNQEFTFPLPTLLHRYFRPVIRQPGSYELYISVGTRAGTPRIAQPLPNNDGKSRYRLGTLKAVLNDKK